MGIWETDPFLGDNKITRFYDDWRDDAWYTTSATLKGDLGFAELSLTGTYFDRKVNYELDDTNYAQWRTDHFGTYYALYDTGTLHAIDLQLAEAESLGLRGPAHLEGREQAEMDGRRLLRGRVRLVGIRRQDSGGLTTTNAWAEANDRACDDIDDTAIAACPLAPSDIYYYNKYHNEVKQLAFFGEMTYALTDKWSVTGGARWFEYDRNMFDQYRPTVRTAGPERSRRERTRSARARTATRPSSSRPNTTSLPT